MTIHDGPLAITTAAQVNARPEFQNLNQAQLGWVVQLAQDPTVATSIQQAIAGATPPRTTVVAGVDGSGGVRELSFLADAWEHNHKAIAYDPQMTPAVVRSYLNQHGNANTLLLRQASITQFGAHVQNIDVLVPHPGPWVKEPFGDLATCLEAVMGQNSQAYVLTDNEPGHGYAVRLQERIQEINQAHANDPNYQPMAVQVQVPAALDAQPLGTGSIVELGGLPLQLGHAPEYRVIHVTR